MPEADVHEMQCLSFNRKSMGGAWSCQCVHCHCAWDTPTRGNGECTSCRRKRFDQAG
jgi:hypothetical protein